MARRWRYSPHLRQRPKRRPRLGEDRDTSPLGKDVPEEDIPFQGEREFAMGEIIEIRGRAEDFSRSSSTKVAPHANADNPRVAPPAPGFFTIPKLQQVKIEEFWTRIVRFALQPTIGLSLWNFGQVHRESKRGEISRLCQVLDRMD
jgi:hypothetical protein